MKSIDEKEIIRQKLSEWMHGSAASLAVRAFIKSFFAIADGYATFTFADGRDCCRYIEDAAKNLREHPMRWMNTQTSRLAPVAMVVHYKDIDDFGVFAILFGFIQSMIDAFGDDFDLERCLHWLDDVVDRAKHFREFELKG